MTIKQRHNPYSSLPKLLPTNAYTIPDVFIRWVVKNEAINKDALKEASKIHVNIWNTADKGLKQNYPGDNILSIPYFEGI